MRRNLRSLQHKLPYHPAEIAGFLGIFVAVGAVVILTTHAVGLPIAFEAEQGTLAGQAATAAVTGASGGSGVKFATAATPTPTPVGGDPCATFPALPAAKPDASNTGVPTGTALTAYAGPTTITTAGTVIDGKIITSQLTIQANNVTVKNSKLGPGGFWAVQVADNITGTKILHSEVYAPNGGYTGIGMTDGIVCATHIHGYENGITAGQNMIIQANYIHGLKGDGSTEPHYDAIEVYSGSNTNVWGNTLYVNDPNNGWLDETGALNITTEWSNITNVTAKGNWFGGGSYSVYVRKSGSGNAYTYSNINFINNRWMGSAPAGFAAYGPMSDDGNITTFTGNVWDSSGAPI
jgi:hypothetical protein